MSCVQKVIFYTVVLTLFLPIPNVLLGQSLRSKLGSEIYSRDYSIVQNSNVKIINVDYTGYYASGEYYNERKVYSFSDNGNKIEGAVFKNGKPLTQMIFYLDSAKNISRSTIRTNIPAMGWREVNKQYTYEGGLLILEEFLGADGSATEAFKYSYDSCGHPTSLSRFDNYGNLLAYELMSYNHATGMVFYKIMNSDNRVIFSETFPYNEGKKSIEKRGDEIVEKVSWPFSNSKDNVEHIYTRRLDKAGNWIIEELHIAVKGKRKISHKVSRDITY